MIDKEKEIEEMAEVIDNRISQASWYMGSMNKGKGYWIAQELINTYRKADEVRKETFKNFAEKVKCAFCDVRISYKIDELLKEYGGE